MATLEELYGPERAAEIRQKQSEAGRRSYQAWVERVGPEGVEERRQAFVEKTLWASRHSCGDTKGLTYELIYGKEQAKQIRAKMRAAQRRINHGPHSDDRRRRISEGVKAHWAKRRQQAQPEAPDQKLDFTHPDH